MNINLTLFAQALTFAAFIWVTAKFIWPMLSRVVDARQKHIAEGLAAAERGKQELEQAAVKTAELLREARSQTQEILAQADKRGAQIVEDAKVAASEEAARLLAAAKAEIEQEVSRAREMLREQVAALAIAGAEQILRREVDAKVHADLLSGLQAQL